MKKNPVRKFTIIYGILLSCFSIFVLLDSFVLPHRYEKVFAAPAETSQEDTGSEKPPRPDRTASDNGTDNEPGGWKEAGKEEGGRKHPPHPGNHSKEKWSGSPSGNQVRKPPFFEERTEHEGTEIHKKNNTDNENTETNKNTGDKQIVSPEGNGIALRTDRINGTDIHVADIILSSVESLKTAFADDTYGRNITDTTSDIAEENGAVLAINGDFYGSRQSGYVIRNGILYRDTPVHGGEDLVIYRDGSFEIINEDEISADELVSKGAWQVFSFGPALVEDGDIAVEAGDEVGKAMYSNPRTAIGIIDDLHYVFVVSDGRTDDNEGLTLMELAEYMQGLGVKTAYNLDGGGSSAMVFEGSVVNEPTTSGRSIKERSVSDIVYIK